MVARLCEAVIKDQHIVYPISIQPDGWCGIHEESYLSVPCILGANGVSHIINLTLEPQEVKALQDAARLLRRIIDSIKI